MAAVDPRAIPEHHFPRGGVEAHLTLYPVSALVHAADLCHMSSQGLGFPHEASVLPHFFMTGRLAGCRMTGSPTLSRYYAPPADACGIPQMLDPWPVMT